MLGTLRNVWAPEAFIVSFKLETDEQILISKVGVASVCVVHPQLFATLYSAYASLLQQHHAGC